MRSRALEHTYARANWGLKFRPDANTVLWLPGQDDPQSATIRDRSGGDPNLLSNGNFEVGDPPDDWTLVGGGATVSRSSTQAKIGTYSALLTRNGTDCHIYQAYSGYAAYAGKTVTLGCWVYATVAARVGIGLGDGVGSASSTSHTGVAGWEWLTTSLTVDASPTYLRSYLEVFDGDTSAYFDGAILTCGELSPKSGVIVGATWAQTGQGLWYLQNDGVDDRTTVADSPSLDITDKITILIWARTTAWDWPGHAGTDGWVIEKGVANDSVGYGIRGHDTLGKFFYHISDGGVLKSVTGDARDAATWFLVGMTYDGATLTGYINGVADGTPLAYVGDIDSSNGFPLLIGSNADLNREYYGDLTLTRILSGVAWSTARIASIYQQERHLFDV